MATKKTKAEAKAKSTRGKLFRISMLVRDTFTGENAFSLPGLKSQLSTWAEETNLELIRGGVVEVKEK